MDTKIGSLHLAHGVPKGFIPSQDMGFLLINVQLPDAASVDRTQAVMAQIAEIAQQHARQSRTRWRSPGSSFVLK